MGKYTMTDAAAKRITKIIMNAVTGGEFPGDKRMTIETVQEALKAEDFSGFKRSHISALMQYWSNRVAAGDKPEFHAHMLFQVADRFVFEYYEQREGIRNLHGGLQQLGILPYPEDD